MATNSFLKFNESNTNIQTYAQYLAATERLNGFPFGSKPSSVLTNRFYRDNAAMIYAFAEFMKTQGFNADPSDITSLVANIPLALDVKTNSNAIVSRMSTTFALTSTGTDTYTAIIPGLASLAELQGIPIKILANFANSGAATINFNSLGAKNITRDANVALVTGDIPLNAVVTLVYDGTQFQVVGLTSDANKAALASANTFTERQTYSKPSITDLTPADNIKVYRDLAQAALYSQAQRTVIIELPSFDNAFYTMRILGYDYGNTANDKNAWGLLISTQASDPYNSASAVLTGTAPFNTVRLGKNAGGKPVILLGTLTTTWDYSHISIMETVGRDVGTPDGWSISFATSEAGITIQKTPVLQGDKRTAKLAANYTFTAAAFADVPGFVHNVVAGTTYRIKLNLRTSGSGGSDSGGVSLVLTTAVGTSTGIAFAPGLTPEIYSQEGLTNLGTAAAIQYTNGAPKHFIFDGVFVCTTSGTIKLQASGTGGTVTKVINAAGSAFTIESI